jgi:hypothetical protein
MWPTSSLFTPSLARSRSRSLSLWQIRGLFNLGCSIAAAALFLPLVDTPGFCPLVAVSLLLLPLDTSVVASSCELRSLYLPRGCILHVAPLIVATQLAAPPWFAPLACFPAFRNGCFSCYLLPPSAPPPGLLLERRYPRTTTKYFFRLLKIRYLLQVSLSLNTSGVGLQNTSNPSELASFLRIFTDLLLLTPH